jgi:hypothetical protein
MHAEANSDEDSSRSPSAGPVGQEEEMEVDAAGITRDANEVTMDDTVVGTDLAKMEPAAVDDDDASLLVCNLVIS